MAGRTPPKRMRLGTRSCAECRRRRVRCIFPPNSRVCEACTLHSTECRAQQQTGPDDTSRDSGGSGDTATGLHKRIEELETVVQQLCGALQHQTQSSPVATSIGHGSPSPIEHSQMATTQAIGQFLAPRQESRPGNRPLRVGTSEGSVASTQYHSFGRSSPGSLEALTPLEGENCGDEESVPEEAPLIDLMKLAMVIEAVKDGTTRDAVPITENTAPSAAFALLQNILPSPAALTSILDITAPYWPTWPAYFYGPHELDRLTPENVGKAKEIITQTFASRTAPSLAKATLWLALCIQQLPLGWSREGFRPPARPADLVITYMQHASTMLSGGLEPTISSIECCLFEFKLFINMGKPRQAWLSIRQGINACTMLGLHHRHHHTNTAAEERQKYVWTEMLQVDAQLSIILGLPATISLPSPIPSERGAPQKGPDQHDLASSMHRIASAIVERDQKKHNSDQAEMHAATFKIEEDWERCKALFVEQAPPFDGDDSNTPISLGASYYREVSRMMFFLLGKYIHMPYLLKRERRFEHNRESAKEACREMVRAYLAFRGNRLTRMTICELMDFQAFSAGMVLAVVALASSSGVSREDTRQGRDEEEEYDDEDWPLVESLSFALDETSRSIDCRVAAQGAEVLRMIIAAHCGDGRAPKHFEAVIPYFGRVQITSRAPAAAATASSMAATSVSTSASTTATTTELGPFSLADGAMDLSADLFDSAFMGDLSLEAELNIDWTRILEQRDE